MKQLFFFIEIMAIFVISFSQNVTDSCSLWHRYDQKVEENANLQKIIQELKKDSTQMSKQILVLEDDTTKLYQQLKQSNDYWEKLKNANDSLQKIQSKFKNQKDSLNKVKSEVANLQNNNNMLNNGINYLDDHFKKASVNELLSSSSKEELLFYKEFYRRVNKPVPSVIDITINYFDAIRLCKIKFNKQQVNALLPRISTNNAPDSVVSRLKNYEAVDKAASELWEKIHKEVCSDTIKDEDFPQIQAKRQIWQRTQKFLNQYPNLSTEYPYVFDQLQIMLREIWDNANNFNKRDNPFTQ